MKFVPSIHGGQDYMLLLIKWIWFDTSQACPKSRLLLSITIGRTAPIQTLWVKRFVVGPETRNGTSNGKTIRLFAQLSNFIICYCLLLPLSIPNYTGKTSSRFRVLQYIWDLRFEILYILSYNYCEKKL